MIDSIVEAIQQLDFVTTQLYRLAETEVPEETKRMMENLAVRCNEVTKKLDAALINAAHATCI